MKLALASVFLGLVVLAGCDKPSERDCRRAIGNIRKLMGTSQMTLADGQDAAWLRSCKGAAKKKSVMCAINATTTDQLKACGLLKGEQLEELEAIDRAVRERAPAPAPTPMPAPTPEPPAPTPTPAPAAPTPAAVPTPDPAAPTPAAAPTPTPAAAPTPTPAPATPPPAPAAPTPAPSPAPATP
ncbi:MAG: hypothetical protein KBG48_01320 [Kofleriaceae bacterium]|nr:hypothetical protein [Kofleriaceae bacterium]MBP9165985.1 hypothetical protein [Kofleriaceae bacterium]MBP9857336.1 hypothetical protein [Kofleriaceae bacterium]